MLNRIIVWRISDAVQQGIKQKTPISFALTFIIHYICALANKNIITDMGKFIKTKIVAASAAVLLAASCGNNATLGRLLFHENLLNGAVGISEDVDFAL